MSKRKNKQSIVNISTYMWESEMSETCELKQTPCQISDNILYIIST